MKLAVHFGLDTKPHIVEWDKEFLEFPQILLYDDKYWQWTLYNKDDSGQAEQMLIYGRISEAALPCNMFGVTFPVPDFKSMFNIQDETKKCECGAKFSSFPNHHMDKCPLWSKL